MASIGPEQLSELVDAHCATLLLYARQWCSAPEDVVQEAFIGLIRESELPQNVAGWLYRVVRNGAISASRSAARRTRHEARAAAQVESWFEPCPDNTLDAMVATAALAEMPIDQREVIVLRLWADFSFEQIAKVMDSSVSTAHRRFIAALTELRKRIERCATKTMRDQL